VGPDHRSVALNELFVPIIQDLLDYPSPFGNSIPFRMHSFSSDQTFSLKLVFLHPPQSSPFLFCLPYCATLTNVENCFGPPPLQVGWVRNQVRFALWDPHCFSIGRPCLIPPWAIFSPECNFRSLLLVPPRILSKSNGSDVPETIIFVLVSERPSF